MEEIRMSNDQKSAITRADTPEQIRQALDYDASRQALEGEAVDVERIADTVRDYLGDIFACTRVWEAWQRGRLGDV
jgi:hypothetical protein